MAGVYILTVAAILAFIVGAISISNSKRDITGPMVIRGFSLGLVCGAFTGIVVAICSPLIAGDSFSGDLWMLPAGILGAFIGGATGASVGTVSASLLGIITSRYFQPLTNIAQYQWVVTVTGIISTVCLVIIAGWVLEGNLIQTSYDAAVRASEINLYIALPATFGAFLSIPSSLCLVRWYVARSSQLSALKHDHAAT